MVRIDVTYEGDLHTVCVHGPSKSRLETDAPKDNEGRGERFSPTDLTATALGSCMLTTMGILARRHDWKIEGARVEVQKHMTPQPGRRIGKLVLRFRMPGGVPADARAPLERAAASCPVHRSLHPDVVVDATFDWPE